MASPSNVAWSVNESNNLNSHIDPLITHFQCEGCTGLRHTITVVQCGHAAAERQTDTQTDSRDHYTFRVVYDSREM